MFDKNTQAEFTIQKFYARSQLYLVPQDMRIIFLEFYMLGNTGCYEGIIWSRSELRLSRVVAGQDRMAQASDAERQSSISSSSPPLLLLQSPGSADSVVLLKHHVRRPQKWNFLLERKHLLL